MIKEKTDNYMNKLLTGEMTPVEFRNYVMKSVGPKISKEEEVDNRNSSKNFDAICAIEDIFPTAEQKLNLEMYITGRLTGEEYRTFLKCI